MDDFARKHYWDVLTSLKGNDYKAESEELGEAIKLPKSLFRYRPVTPDSLGALRENKLYYSTSDYYDDPFDTFINVNIQGFQTVIEGLRKPDVNIKKILMDSVKRAGFDIPEEIVKTWTPMFEQKLYDPVFCNQAVEYVRNIRNEMRKTIWSVCFSENGCNEVLWLKYAQQHRGFAVRYDLDKDELLRCGKEEKCKECGMSSVRTPLYPMYYSREMHDGTKLAQFLCISKLLQLDFKSQDNFKRIIGIDEWETVRISTIKKECHRYDEEWRMIFSGVNAGPICQEWIPGAVILGLNMKSGDRHLVTTIAKDAGINEIYECYISDEGKLGIGLM